MDDKFTLDRTLYKQIKAMDREKMSDFLTSIYLSGKKEAGSAAIDMEKLKAVIGGVKGIGEARLNEIISAIETLYTEEKE